MEDMLRVSFPEFLRTAELGELRLGTPRDELVRLLGAPHAVSSAESAEICKYGDLRFTFVADILFQITLHWRRPPAPDLPVGIALEGWLPTPRMPLVAFESALRELAVDQSIDSGLTFGDQLTLRIGSHGVKSMFMEKELDTIFVAHTPD